MWNLFGELAKDLVGIFADGVKSKRRIKEAQAEAKIAIAHAQVQAEIDWDTQSMINQQTSWKDEWFTILLSIPLIGVFVPNLRQHVYDGFIALGSLPEWYIAFIAVAVSASFGYRKLAQPFIEKRVNDSTVANKGDSD